MTGLTHPIPKQARRLSIAALTGLTLVGCANLAADQGMSPVEALSVAGFGQAPVKIRNPEDAAAIRSRVAALLARPLTAESAVRIAILNNRGLQSAFNELGVTEAQLSAALLPPGPKLSYTSLAAFDALEIERQVVVDVLAIVTLPKRKEIAEDRLKAAQLKTMEELLRIARAAQRGYIRAVAASQTVDFLSKAQLASETTAELARKLGETGGMNRLDQAREDVSYAELSAQLAAARLRGGAEREKLTQLLGLWGEDVRYRLPARLAPLPARPRTIASVEHDAIRNRIDLAMSRTEVEAQAKALGLTEATRFVELLEAGAADLRQNELLNVNGNTISDNIHTRGYEVGVQIPVFDFNENRIRSEREAYMQKVNRLFEKAVRVRSEARLAYAGYRGSYDIARYYRDRVTPLRKIIADEDQLHYNGMLLDLFKLLADARASVTSTIAGIDALRNFWLADVDLQAAVLGGGSGTAPEAVASAATAGEGVE